MYHRRLKKDLAVEQNLGKKNLLVSGCSFTSNVEIDSIDSWPYYLRDLGGFEMVYDCSWAGCGNYHIHNSIIHAIETETDLRSDNTVVVVMWSGYDRDDFVIDPGCAGINKSLFLFNETAGSGYTGGLSGTGNMLLNVENVKKIKSLYSRSLENYLMIQGLAKYLQALHFPSVFCEFSTGGTTKDNNFDPVLYLEPVLQDRFVGLVRQVTPNLGSWAKQNTKTDGYHPTADQHLSWTRSVLLPYVMQTLEIFH